MTIKESVEQALAGFQSLGDKSRETVFEWAEQNEPHPLATAYMGACVAIADLDCAAIAEGLERHWRGNSTKRWTEAYKPYALGFVYRDTIGRMILGEIKRANEAERRKSES